MLEKPKDGRVRRLRISCFTCGKTKEVFLKHWQVQRDIQCPSCTKKEIVIQASL